LPAGPLGGKDDPCKSNSIIELSQDIAKRIRNSPEIGDETTLIAVAEELKSYSASCMPLSKKIIQMAEDFEFDGILQLADDLDSC
jgi:hypothetical protein